jgi:glycosyltransferase involved in cell wall biosynthesis
VSQITKKPLVSVIIPSYNAERWIGEAIGSVCKQIYPNIEIVVVDDGSTDGTVDKVKTFKDFDVRLICQNNKGACSARNVGLLNSRGEYVQWLDADDYIEPTKIEDQIKVALKNPDCIVYGPWKNIIHTEHRIISGPLRCTESIADILETHLSDIFCTNNALLMPKPAVAKIGGWDESLTADQDGDLLLRLVWAGYSFVFADGGAAIWRHHDTGKQTSKRVNIDALKSRFAVIQKTKAELENRGEINKYKYLLSYRALAIARSAVRIDEGLQDESERIADELLGGIICNRLVCFDILRRLIGIGPAEKLTRFLRRVIDKAKGKYVKTLSPWYFKRDN